MSTTSSSNNGTCLTCEWARQTGNGEVPCHKCRLGPSKQPLIEENEAAYCKWLTAYLRNQFDKESSRLHSYEEIFSGVAETDFTNSIGNSYDYSAASIAFIEYCER